MNSAFDISRITDDLFIGTTPAKEDYELLRREGIGLVINMRLERRPYPDMHPAPLQFLWLPTIDWPLFPIPQWMLQRGVHLALEAIKSGKGVLAHCAGGRHRSVAMAAAILIAQGYEAQEAMQLIASRRPTADPFVYYIRERILRFAREWRT